MIWQIFGLQVVSMTGIVVLAIEANSIILGAMALLGVIISTLGSVFVATRRSTQETDRIIAALQRQTLTQSEDARLAANKLASQTVVAADKVSENRP